MGSVQFPKVLQIAASLELKLCIPLFALMKSLLMCVSFQWSASLVRFSLCVFVNGL